MSTKLGDVVRQTSTTTGTGDLSLSSVSGSIKTFNEEFGTGGTDNFRYTIYNEDAADEVEHGTGHLSDSSTLVRDTVKVSTNNDNKVNFTSGTKQVTNVLNAADTPDIEDADSDDVFKGDGTWSDFNTEVDQAGQAKSFVVAEQTSDVSLTSNTWTQIPFDGNELEDTNSEFDSGQFMPDNDGFYWIKASAEFQINSANDCISVRLRNVDDNTTSFLIEQDSPTAENFSFNVAENVELTNSKTYELQVRNADNSDTVTGDATKTRLAIRQVII